jgi:hypothetical protein
MNSDGVQMNISLDVKLARKWLFGPRNNTNKPFTGFLKPPLK